MSRIGPRNWWRVYGRGSLRRPRPCSTGQGHESRSWNVYIGGDSAGVSGYSMTVRADSKVFSVGPYLMGFTTSFRMGQLIRYALEAQKPAGDLDRFMATNFIDAVRACLKAGGWAKKDNDREEGGTFLVGVHGRLFTVEEDYQVTASADGYAAIGCGSELALGALYATARTRMSPKRRVVLALQAAERFSTGVRGPFLCLSQDGGAEVKQ
jgi:ATP-dependent protease HslVU (ClpYQ) peptidase subunit